MRPLLDIPTQRRLNILEQLNEADTWVSSNQLATLNNASLRTIHNDINFLKETYTPYLTIETSKKNGVRLLFHSCSHLKMVYQDIYKQSDAFSLIESVFFDTSLSIERWGTRLFVSESSLYRIVNDITISLGQFNLTLEKKPCRILGKKELDVRYFFVRFFKEKYFIYDWPFEASKDDSFHLCSLLLDLTKTKLDENLLIQMCHLVNISLIRSSQGFTINEKLTAPQAAIVEKIKQQPDIMGYLNNLFATYNLEPSHEEIGQLVYCLANFITYWIYDEAQAAEANHTIGLLVNNIKTTFRIDLEPDLEETLFQEIRQAYLFYNIFPYQNYLLFDEYQEYKNTIQKDFPIFSQVIKQKLLKIENESNFPWYRLLYPKILYILITQWEFLAEKIDERKAKVAVLVLSDQGQAHTNFLIRQVTHSFGDRATFYSAESDLFFFEKTTSENFESYDLVLTTFATDLIPCKKLIVINNIPSNHDWQIMRQAIKKRYIKKQEDIFQLNQETFDIERKDGAPF